MNDKTKNLDEIPVIKPARDEVDSRRRSIAAQAPRQSNFNGMLVFSLVLMAIMMGVGGYTLFEVQQRLNQSNELLDQAQKSVRDLEDRLQATGTDVSKTLQTLQADVKTNFSEIDKLWAVSYRQNRPKIAEIEATVEKLDAARTALDASVKALSAEVKKVSGDFSQLTSTVNETRQNLLDENSEMTTQVSVVRGQMQDQSVLVEGNRRNIDAINNKLKEVDEAIEVYDRYRQQVNQRIMDLQNQVQSAPAAP